MHGCSGGGVWLLWGGMCGCSQGGMHGCSGACVVALGGHVWLLLGGMCGCSWGACMVAPRGCMHGCSRGACVVAPGGACVVAPRGACVVAPGGHAQLLWGGHAWLLQGEHAWLLCGGACVVAWGVCVVASGAVHGCSRGVCMVAPGGHAWDMTRYGDTVNEQAVRILLECILVIILFTVPCLSDCANSQVLINSTFVCASIDFWT